MKSRVRRDIVNMFVKHYYVQVRIAFIWINIAKFYDLRPATEFRERLLK